MSSLFERNITIGSRIGIPESKYNGLDLLALLRPSILQNRHYTNIPEYDDDYDTTKGIEEEHEEAYEDEVNYAEYLNDQDSEDEDAEERGRQADERDADQADE